MKTIPLSEVVTMSPGSIIEQTSGVLKRVFKYTTRDGQYGPSSFQGAVLADGNVEVKLKLKNHPDQAGCLGKRIWLMAKEGKKGWTGVKVEEDEYEGKKELVLAVTATAIIGLADAPAKTQPTTTTAQPAPAPVAAPAQAKTQPVASATSDDPWHDVKVRVGQLGNLYALIMRKLSLDVAPSLLQLGIELTSDQIQSGAATIYIQYCKAYPFDDMPRTPLPAPRKKAAPARQAQQPQQQTAQATQELCPYSDCQKPTDGNPCPHCKREIEMCPWCQGLIEKGATECMHCHKSTDECPM